PPPEVCATRPTRPPESRHLMADNSAKPFRETRDRVRDRHDEACDPGLDRAEAPARPRPAVHRRELQLRAGGAARGYGVEPGLSSPVVVELPAVDVHLHREQPVLAGVRPLPRYPRRLGVARATACRTRRGTLARRCPRNGPARPSSA